MGTVTRINEGDWSDGTSLWRYMDIYGFLSLLTGQKLKFTNLSEFEDGFEGRMPFNNSATLNIDFSDDSKCFSRSVDEVVALTENLESIRKRTWVTSWQQSDDECSLMWRVYGSRQNGVALKTTAGDLIAALDPTNDYIVGPVKYINYILDRVPDEQNFFFTFHKQQGYFAEQEFRIALTESHESFDDKPQFVQFDLNKALEKIVLSPWAEKWQLDALKEVLRSFMLDPNLIGYSSILRVGK